MLTSRQPIWVGWGRELHFFYNDAYKSIIGGKHPRALAEPTAVVWSEIWTDIGPMLDTAMSGMEGTYVEEQLLIMERNGYPEETYYTFSYSPIPDDDGNPGGIICANTDDTQRVIGERQLTLLRELATRTANARTRDDACEQAALALATNPQDLPFALLYMSEAEDDCLSLVATQGIDRSHPGAPATIRGEGMSVWPCAEVMTSHKPRLISELGDQELGVQLPLGAWSQPPHSAAILPVVTSGEVGRPGILVVGLNPYRVLDEGYQGFLELVAGQIGSAIGNAQAYEEERRRAEALAEIDRAKTTFFSNVSHEFRTPLTLMLGPLEELMARHQGDTESADRTLIEVTHRNSLRLLKLVNILLDFSRIEAGRVRTHFAATDLASYTADIASTFRSAMEKAGLKLVVTCPALPNTVFVDRDMWEKIVLNLLSNAFKFTFTGEVTVTMAAAKDGLGAELVIADTGIGISEAELPRLFERFHRIEGSRGRTIEGSGIGLALVQELVRLHGGSIRVESEVGRGTRFHVVVPFGRQHLTTGTDTGETEAAASSLRADAYVQEALRWLPGSAAEAGEESSPIASAAEDVGVPSGGAEKGKRILVADDNADLRDYIGRLLRGEGYTVEMAVDGEAALSAARSRAPDLVLSDVMMPKLDGFGLLAALREDETLRHTPVLLLSARAGEEARVGGLEAGADDYLTKPFAARELLARVASNLQFAQIRKESEERLREDARTLEHRVHLALAERDRLWELSEDLLVIADSRGRLVRVSPSWTRVLGHAPEELLGQDYIGFLHPDECETVSRDLAALPGSGRSKRFENRVKTADGSWRWISWTVSADEATDMLHGVGRDVTADKEAAVAIEQAAEALRLAQKMEAIGRLTGGVAHDFNNLLQVVGGNLQLLSKDVAGSERAEQRVKNALAGVTRGAKLASQLLAFGRRQPLAPKVVNLGRFVRGLDDMLRRALGDGIEIETVIGGGLWNVFTDSYQVENALLNLAINARDAMDGHGRLTIEAGNASLDDAYAARHVDVVPGQYVMLAVTDTGCGIAPEILEQVFEPFYTTKPEGQGTGLGLSMVYGFVKQSNGHIKIYSEPGQGTTVRLYLPRVRQSEDLASDVEVGPVVGGSETILVVEDDEDVRSTVVEMLSELGYRVLKARDAHSGLAIIESGVSLDVLFTDVVMPGPLRSPELARKARERLPDIAVLFTSGYTDNAIVHNGRLDEDTELLSKPYTREALARKIRHVLRNRVTAA